LQRWNHIVAGGGRRGPQPCCKSTLGLSFETPSCDALP
jgi:hypothetical protein